MEKSSPCFIIKCFRNKFVIHYNQTRLRNIKYTVMCRYDSLLIGRKTEAPQGPLLDPLYDTLTTLTIENYEKKSSKLI